MATVEKFRSLRRDGHVVEEGMGANEMLQLGWRPCKIASVEWRCDSQVIRIPSAHGIVAKVAPGRDGVVAIESLDEDSSHTSLSVFNADGTLRFRTSNTQQLYGQDEQGYFAYQTQARASRQGCFGAVFNVQSDHSQVQIDFDERSGEVVGVYRVAR